MDPTNERQHRIVYAVAFGGAMLLHLGVGVALGAIEPATALAIDRELPPVEFTPIEPPPPSEPEPEPVVEAPPEPAPAPEPVRRERVVERAPEPPPEAAPPPPPAAETPIDFSNMTLTGEGGSFAVQASSTTESDRIGRPGAQVTGRSREGVAGGVPGGTGDGPPRPIPVADLRQPPRIPSALEAILQRRYPPEAKAQSIEGVVSTRIVILADGRPASIRVTRESVEGYGFGAACRRAIEEAGRWSTPVGPDGQPTATSITFRCEFQIR